MYVCIYVHIYKVLLVVLVKWYILVSYILGQRLINNINNMTSS